MSPARDLGTQLSTWRRLALWARSALLAAAIALAGWLAGVPAFAGVVLAFWLLYRLITLFEESMFQPPIVVTETDAQRLASLLDELPAKDRRHVEGLQRELERAHVVPSQQVPADVVTMNSRVRFEELNSGTYGEARLVYQSAEQADVSVLAPVGSALLGLSVGQAIDWRMPNGRLRRYRVVELIYQPEAAGDLHL